MTILPSLLNNNYEKCEIEIFKNILKPGMTIVDIGANVGLYSVIASKVVGKKGRVYSFEPEPLNYKVLKKNISLNNCQNVLCEQMALGDKSGTAYLFKEARSIGTHSMIKKKHGSQEKISVKVTKLDEYFSSTKKIDAIKIDVEGFELSVLVGARMILKNVNYLFFEFTKNERNDETTKFIKHLSGFRYFYLINEKTSRTKQISLQSLAKLHYANILASKNPLSTKIKLKVNYKGIRHD